MGGLCGWISAEREADGRDALLRAASSLVAGDGSSPRTATASQATIAAVGSERNSAVVEADGLILAIYGHPRWNDRQRHAEGLQAFGRQLISAWRESGVDVLRSLNGDFALVMQERNDGSCILAVDRFSTRNLVYLARGQRLVFGSTLDALAIESGDRLELDPQSLFDYVCFHVVPGPRTIYHGPQRVAPGHYVRFDRSGRIEERPVSPLRFVEDRRAPIPELKSQFVDSVQQATADCAADLSCGTFLSGGTDSSTITGMLGRVTGRPAATFSIGFAAEGFDEMQYARLAARHFGAKHYEYYVTPADVVDAAPRIAAAYDQPFGNASAIPTYYCARLAREHGIERMLGGDGGDELFGGNSRYAKQQVFAYYEMLPRVLRARLLEPLLLGIEASRRLPLVRKVRRYVEQAMVPMPQRYETDSHVDYIGAEAIFEPDFLRSVDRDHPHALMREAHAPYADRSLVNQMLGIDFRFTLADGDLPKVTRMCELAGVDVAFPMLDETVVAFSAQLPPDLKLRGTQLRWLFKEALRGFLPPEIIAKKKHGFGLPVGVWLASHKPLFDLAQASLDRLRRRGIVRPDFLDRLTTQLLQEHAGFYGVMVWVLMMLSLWLDSRRL